MTLKKLGETCIKIYEGEQWQFAFPNQRGWHDAKPREKVTDRIASGCLIRLKPKHTHEPYKNNILNSPHYPFVVIEKLTTSPFVAQKLPGQFLADELLYVVYKYKQKEISWLKGVFSGGFEDQTFTASELFDRFNRVDEYGKLVPCGQEIEQ